MNSTTTAFTRDLPNGTRLAGLHRPGEGQPVVLLHGITDSAAGYEPLFDQIDSHHPVYALDLRGHGNSSKPDTLYDTSAYADDVCEFIRSLDTPQKSGPVLLGGHSLGGLVTVQVAVTAPELVSRIFLEDPPLYFVGKMDDTYRAAFEGMVVMATTLQDGSRSRQEWHDIMAAAPDPWTGKPGIETMGEERIQRRLDAIGSMKPRALREAIDGSLQWDTDQVLRQITCHVTLLTGNQALGAVISEEESSRVQSMVSDCELVHVEDVGHLIHDQKPAAWANHLNSWISRS